MRKTILMLSPILIIVLFFGVIYYLYCNALSFERVDRELERLQSPNKLYESILVESNAGATTPFDYLVYIKPSGEEIIKGDRIVFGAYHINGRNIYWKNDDTLRIEYERAKILSFRNYITLKISDKYHEIHIEEVCTRTNRAKD